MINPIASDQQLLTQHTLSGESEFLSDAIRSVVPYRDPQYDLVIAEGAKSLFQQPVNRFGANTLAHLVGSDPISDLGDLAEFGSRPN